MCNLCINYISIGGGAKPAQLATSSLKIEQQSNVSQVQHSSSYYSNNNKIDQSNVAEQPEVSTVSYKNLLQDELASASTEFDQNVFQVLEEDASSANDEQPSALLVPTDLVSIHNQIMPWFAELKL